MISVELKLKQLEIHLESEQNYDCYLINDLFSDDLIIYSHTILSYLP